MKTNVQPPFQADWTDPVIMRAVQRIVDLLIAEARARRAAQQKAEVSDERQR